MKFYEKTWFMFLMLVLLAPVGIFLLWKYKRFGKVPRILLSIVFGLFFLGIAFGNSEDAQLTAVIPAETAAIETSNESTKSDQEPSENQVDPAITPTGSGTLKVHFIDVGQADSILIQSPTGASILIDGGNNDDGTAVVNYLKSQGVKELSAMVATHPHEDHIGGLDTVINSIKTNQVYMPNATANTQTFEAFVAAVKASGAKRIQTKSGVNLDVDGLSGVFLAPISSEFDDTNDYSAVLKITHGETSFLMTGDAESVSEGEMLRSDQNLKATVLKVGHHGSGTSTTTSFLKAVSPKFAVISVGSGNNYGHPHPDALTRLSNEGIPVFRTDQSGTIIATSDGTTVTFDKASSPIKPQAPPATSKPAPTTKSSTEPTNTPTTSNPTPSNGGVKITNIDLSGEIVTLKNTGSSTVDLTGWKIVSETGSQTFNFPAGTTIQAGGTLQILSGKGVQAGGNQLIWGNANIWNNSGDPGVLYNAAGKLVSRY